MFPQGLPSCDLVLDPETIRLETHDQLVMSLMRFWRTHGVHIIPIENLPLAKVAEGGGGLCV